MPLIDPAPPANLLWFDRIDSSNAVATRLMKAWDASAEEPLAQTVVVVGEQTEGVGRRGNRWASPHGGLYATWLGWLPSSVLPVLPLAAGVACAEAVEAVCPQVAIGLKWPNDLVHGGRKLGGLLCHARSAGERSWVCVGVGVNIELAPALPTADPNRSVCLRELGFVGELQPAVWALVGTFIARFDAAVAAPVRARQRWLARQVHRPGDALRVRLEADVLEGRFVGFSAEGHLELDVDGRRELLATADLVEDLADTEG
jgi:BirA family transcriptional regulator, biotin operon repressor / biotin---[acetyl-CoA-carboxylase] ligase